ncbi:MAG: FAD-dependent oxidoreductase [Clostridiales bacterium]|nr:FAD-dependent oxidoreductase [Clostridiales bacterium]
MERVPLRADPKFKHRVNASPIGETMKVCYQCGSCTAACPISKYIDIYRPNKIIECSKLGIRSLAQSNAFLFCCACTLCTKACPQGVKVHEVMQALKELTAGDGEVKDFLAGDFGQVVEDLGRQMPFPVVYSWICLRPDDAFDGLVKPALENALKSPAQQATQAENAARVAVIGSGPAGLTAAWSLAKAGLKVTVYESLPELGGMLKTGIPSYRLPKAVLDAEIAKIKAMGVEMKTNAPVEKSFFEGLITGGDYAAVFVATGAYKSRKIGLEGEDLAGVVPAIDFLKDYNLNGSAKVGKNVVVIGGGNVATDAAGAAKRCGAESVRLFSLEDRKTMPAHEWEIEEIAVAGVEINPSWGPKAILGESGKVTGVELVRCKSVFDANGRFNPVFDERTTQTIEADMVITAIGQAPDLDFLGEDIGIFKGVIQADPYTMETSLPGVFAGGDAATGTASLIEAITDGKTAAKSILRYLKERDA